MVSHRNPIWYTDDDKVLIVPPKGEYVRPWCEDPPEGSFAIDRETREILGPIEELGYTKFSGEEKVLIPGWILQTPIFLSPAMVIMM